MAWKTEEFEVTQLFIFKFTTSISKTGEGRSVFEMLTDKPAGKRSLAKSRRRWAENIRMNLKEIGINTRDCVDLARIGITGEPL